MRVAVTFALIFAALSFQAQAQPVYKGQIFAGGQPVDHAWVSLEDSATRIGLTKTQKDGRFVVTHDSRRRRGTPKRAIDGPLMLHIKHPSTGEFMVPAVLGDVQIINRPAGGFIYGKVTDEEGKALEEFSIKIERQGHDFRKKFTDKEGHYRIGPLAEGKYTFEIRTALYKPSKFDRTVLSAQETRADVHLIYSTLRALAQEAVIHSERLQKALFAYHKKHGVLPPSTLLTPVRSACVNGVRTPHQPTADRWQHPTWKALNFKIETPSHYQYRVLSERQNFTVLVIGDLDCDDHHSTFERIGQLIEGTLRPGAGIFKNYPLE